MDVLDRIIYTLNRIDVKGEENMDMMLGCIRALKKMREDTTAGRKDVSSDDDDHE